MATALNDIGAIASEHGGAYAVAPTDGVPNIHQPGGSLGLYGYTGLTLDSYNFKRDW
jgi:hypothetical protein